MACVGSEVWPVEGRPQTDARSDFNSFVLLPLAPLLGFIFENKCGEFPVDWSNCWVSIQSSFIFTFSLLTAKLWPGAAPLTCGQWFLLFHELRHQKQYFCYSYWAKKEQNSPLLCLLFFLTFNLNLSLKTTKLHWAEQNVHRQKKRELKVFDIRLHRPTFKNLFLFDLDSDLETHPTFGCCHAKLNSICPFCPI